ncbi:MAG: GreA/GreB family elongation factor, partial [Campylobacterales bacterium]|nr:GreA/GreB family elongation factor [Campylobacterales bacterium]
LLNLDTEDKEFYTICGVYESEPENGLISIHSPLAKKMLGKSVGDDFNIKLPTTTKEYELLEIYYKNIFTLKKHIRNENDFVYY